MRDRGSLGVVMVVEGWVLTGSSGDGGVGSSGN